MVNYDPIAVTGLYIEEDRETAERCGASGTFQVITAVLSMNDGTELDVTDNVDQGRHFFSQDEVAESLGLDPNSICYNNYNGAF